MPKNNKIASHLLAFATYALQESEEGLEEIKQSLQDHIDDEYYHGQIDDIVEYALKWLGEDHFKTK